MPTPPEPVDSDRTAPGVSLGVGRLSPAARLLGRVLGLLERLDARDVTVAELPGAVALAEAVVAEAATLRTRLARRLAPEVWPLPPTGRP
jgi:hypothetical protein